MKERSRIKQIKQGNKQALNDLIQEYYPLIYRYIYLKMPIKEDAKDVTQEVFIRFIRQISNYVHKDKLTNYLYSIASSACMDHFRKHKHEADFEIIEETMVDTINIHEDILNKIEIDELKELMARLSSNDQDVLIFYYLYEMSLKEISNILKVPQDTLKSRLYRALKKLRRLWKENGNE